MQALLRMPQALWLLWLMVIAGLAIFGFAIGVLMLPASAVVGDRLPEMTCLQMAFTPGRFTEVFLSFSEAQRAAILNLLLPGDFVFAWGYGLLLAGLTGLVAMRLSGQWLRVGAVVMWMPLLASLLDCIENIFLYAIGTQLLADPASVVAPALPLLASIAATAKYAALSVITPAYGLSAIFRGLLLDRSLSALFLYLLASLLLLSMVLRPLQQIPPCF